MLAASERAKKGEKGTKRGAKRKRGKHPRGELPEGDPKFPDSPSGSLVKVKIPAHTPLDTAKPRLSPEDPNEDLRVRSKQQNKSSQRQKRV